jgi:hypothetical protein
MVAIAIESEETVYRMTIIKNPKSSRQRPPGSVTLIKSINTHEKEVLNIDEAKRLY